MITDKEALAEFIYKRKSVRKYDMTPLSMDILEDIQAYLDGIEPLYGDIRCEFTIADNSSMRGLLGLERVMVSAPHYIIARSEAKGNYNVNIGYMLEYADLFLSAKGLGSCWLGLTRPKKADRDGMEFVITLCFGKPLGSPHRERDGFNRKPAADFAVTEKDFNLLTDTESFLEGVRLSPSAMNSQPWHIELKGGGIDIYREKLNIFKQIITVDKMNEVDMGIFTAVAFLLAKKQGINLKLADKEKSLKGYHYLYTLT